MNTRIVISLAEKFAEVSGNHINPFILKEEKGRYESSEYNDVVLFSRELVDIGSYLKLIFLINNRLQKEEFSKVLEKLSFPIIAFKKADTLIPVIIQHKTEKHYTVYEFNGESPTEIEFQQKNEIISYLANYEELSKISDLPEEVNKYDDAEATPKDIFFITGFQVDSLTSEQSNGDDHSHLTPAQRVFRLLRSERKEIGYLYFYAILTGLINLALPLGLQAMISLISGGVILNSMYVLVALIVIATFVVGWLQVIQLETVEVLQQRVFTKAAYEFSYRIPKLKIESLNKQYTPELINRFFDILTIQKSLPKILIDLISAGLQIGFGLILLAFYHSFFIFFGLLLISLLFLVFRYTWSRGLDTSIQESKYKYKVVYWLEEIARNLVTFKLAGNTNISVERMDKYVFNYLEARQEHFKILKRQYAAIIVFKTLITAGLLILGGFLVVDRQINLGQFVAAEIIIVLVISSVEKLISTLETLYDLLTGAEKVGHVTDIPLENNQGLQLKEVIKDSGIENGLEIQVSNLNYKYPGSKDYSLKNVNFKIDNNERLGIAGFNGCGKTTLLKVITGLLHHYEGLITVDGVSLRDINISDYRGVIGENLTESFVFEGTIEENITVGRYDLKLKDVLWAVEEVGLKEFINNLPNGLKTSLSASRGDFARSLEERIVMARSIVERPRLLVFDDDGTFRSIERNEKKEILNFIMDKEMPWTLISVSNDPLLLSQCTKILFLHEGNVKATGTFDELMQEKDFKLLVTN